MARFQSLPQKMCTFHVTVRQNGRGNDFTMYRRSTMIHSGTENQWQERALIYIFFNSFANSEFSEYNNECVCSGHNNLKEIQYSNFLGYFYFKRLR